MSGTTFQKAGVSASESVSATQFCLDACRAEQMGVLESVVDCINSKFMVAVVQKNRLCLSRLTHGQLDMFAGSLKSGTVRSALLMLPAPVSGLWRCRLSSYRMRNGVFWMLSLKLPSTRSVHDVWNFLQRRRLMSKRVVVWMQIPRRQIKEKVLAVCERVVQRQDCCLVQTVFR